MVVFAWVFGLGLKVPQHTAATPDLTVAETAAAGSGCTTVYTNMNINYPSTCNENAAARRLDKRPKAGAGKSPSERASAAALVLVFKMFVDEILLHMAGHSTIKHSRTVLFVHQVLLVVVPLAMLQHPDPLESDTIV